MAYVFDDATLDRIFRTARTYNGYTDEPVTEQELRHIYDLMKWGPTSANQSPARIIWCVSDEAKAKLAACCSAQNAPKVLKAPVTAIIGMDLEFYEKLGKLFPHTDASVWFRGNDALIKESAFRNSTLQGAYFIIAARMVGLDTGAMSGFNGDAVNEAFFKDSNTKVNFIATLGHGDPASIFGRLPRLDFEEATQIA